MMKFQGTQLIAILFAGALVSDSPANAQSVAAVPGVNVHCSAPARQRAWRDSSQRAECRALEAIATLTPAERRYFELGGVGLGGARDSGSQEANAAAESAERKLGLPAMGGASDGPNGISDLGTLMGRPLEAKSGHVTAFPTVIGLGATWDRALARRFGTALGEEFHGKGLSMVLGPTLNIIRTWHGGRSAETFAEDPFLMSELAVAEISAIQQQGILAMMKHFAANNQEYARAGSYPDYSGVDEIISEKALQEIYFPHFKAAVQRGGVAAVMCAYDKINGQFSCNNPGLLAQLREWGFDGTITPDAGYAQRDAADAARAGVDEASPVTDVEKAIETGAVDPTYFDLKLYHTLVTRFRLGLYDRHSKGGASAVVSTADHTRLAREIATDGAVLLKNDRQALPIAGVRSIAVLGADAGPEAVVMETGSAHVHLDSLKTPIEAIRTRAGTGVRVDYERGDAGARALPPIPAEFLTPPSKEGYGLLGTYFATPYYWREVLTRVDTVLQFDKPEIPPAPAGTLGATEAKGPVAPWSARWEGTLTPPATGLYSFSLTGAGTAEIVIDGRLVIAIEQADFRRTVLGTIELTAMHPVSVLVKYDSGSALLGSGIRLGWQPPDGRLARAVEAAKAADVAIVFAGEELGEGSDKTSFSLPGDQDALIAAVASVNPRTVVVLHTSTAVAMPWLDHVAAVVEAWFPGQEAGTSIASLLFGDVNPSGRLPVTFPHDDSQGAATRWQEYPGDGRTVRYDEGVLVGYRWYDAKGQDPLFPFGHGLSYTTFVQSGIEVVGSGASRSVRITVRNSGARAGAEVVQLYVNFPPEAEDPPKQLKGFAKVALNPGESRVISIALPDSQLMAFDQTAGRWRLWDGRYGVMVGASSRDIRQSTEITIPPR